MPPRKRKTTARGPTPTVDQTIESIISTPNQRGRESSLPPISSRKSNAYGSGTPVLPKTWGVRPASGDFSDVFDDIMSDEIAQDAPGPTSPAAQAPAAASRSRRQTQRATSVTAPSPVPAGGRSTRSRTRAASLAPTGSARHQPSPLAARDSRNPSFSAEYDFFRNAAEEDASKVTHLTQFGPNQLSAAQITNLRQAIQEDVAAEAAAEREAEAAAARAATARAAAAAREAAEAAAAARQNRNSRSPRDGAPLDDGSGEEEPGPGIFEKCRDVFGTAAERIRAPLSSFGRLMAKNASTISLVTLGTIVTLSAILMVLWSSSGGIGIRSYGYDFTHNIGQFVPYYVAHPIQSLFSPDDLLDIRQRLTALEYDIVYLKNRDSLHSEAIRALETALPDFVALNRDGQGNVQIPSDFWRALKSKIQTDYDLLLTFGSDTIDPPRGQRSHSAEGVSWDEFLAQNQRKLDAWARSKASDEFDLKLEKAFKGDVLLTKKELLSLLNRQYSEIKDYANKETAKAVSDLEKEIQAVQQDTQARIAQLNLDTYKHRAGLSQALGYAKAGAKQYTNALSTSVNYLGHKSGAIAHERVTTPTWSKADQYNWLQRRWNSIVPGRRLPLKQAAGMAFTSWEEHGDCWCGKGDSDVVVGAIMSRNIYPSEVVIEHIHPSASLDWHSAPKDMELLAYLDTWESQKAVAQYSQEMLRWDDLTNPVGRDWYKIADWTFDIMEGNIQSFNIKVPLKRLGIPINRVAIRAVSNWGKPDYTCFYRVRLHGEEAGSNITNSYP